jgi:hypothetical protein
MSNIHTNEMLTEAKLQLFNEYFPHTNIYRGGFDPANIDADPDNLDPDIDPFIENNEKSLNILKLAKNKRFDKLFPETFISALKKVDKNILNKKVIDTFQTELRANDNIMNIYAYFIREEDIKFVEYYNRNLTNVTKYYQNTIPEKFFKEFNSKSNYPVEYDPESKKFTWICEKITSHDKHTVYAAFQPYAHKWHTWRRFGDELIWLYQNRGALKLIPSGKLQLPEYYEEFFAKSPELYNNITGLDFIYHHETDKTKTPIQLEEEENVHRKENFLKILKLDPAWDVSISELYYCFYFRYKKSSYPDLETLGEEFIFSILTRNIKNKKEIDIEDYKKLISKIAETVPRLYEITGKKANKNEVKLKGARISDSVYKPASLEKFLWQFAGQYRMMLKPKSSLEHKDWQKIYNWAGKIFSILPPDDKAKFYEDHYILWTRERKENEYGGNKDRTPQQWKEQMVKIDPYVVLDDIYEKSKLLMDGKPILSKTVRGNIEKLYNLVHQIKTPDIPNDKKDKEYEELLSISKKVETPEDFIKAHANYFFQYTDTYPNKAKMKKAYSEYCKRFNYEYSPIGFEYFIQEHISYLPNFKKMLSAGEED